MKSVSASTNIHSNESARLPGVECENSKPHVVRHLVITVHGIRTFGQWQERLERMLREDPNVDVLNYKYGYFSVLAFLIPFLRWIVTRRFRNELLVTAHQHPGARIDLVGHSFGTHLIGWGLYRIPTANRPKIDTIILAGSVLRPGFVWSRFLSGQTVRRVVNECGTNDFVLMLNQVCVLFTGVAGILGFKGMIGDNLRNNWYRFGHSGCFIKDGAADDGFMRERWIPLLVSDHSIPQIDNRPVGSLYGLWAFTLQNLELIKLASYAAMVYGGLLWLKDISDAKGADAARTLAEQSIEVRNRHPELLIEGIALGVQSIKRFVTPEGDLALRESLRLLPIPIASFRRKKAVTSLAFSQDDSRLATATAGNSVQVWNLNKRTPINTVQETSAVEALAFEPHSSNLLIVEQDGNVRLWSGQVQQAYPSVGSEAEKSAIFLDAMGPIVATAVHDFSVHLWDAKHGTELAAFDHDNRILSFGFSADGRWLASGAYDYSVRVWSTAKPSRMRKQINDNHPVSAVALSPDGDRVAFGDTFGLVRIWDLTHDQEVSVNIEHAGWVTSLAFSPDGKWLASSSNDQTARVWDAEDGRELVRMVHEGPVSRVEFSHNGRRVATAGEDGTARVRDIWKSIPIKLQGQLCALRFSSNGRMLGAGDSYGNVTVTSTGADEWNNPLRELPDQENAVVAVAFDSSAHTLTAAFDTGVLLNFDLNRRRREHSVKLDGVSPSYIAMNDDATLAATADWDGNVAVFRTADGKMRASSIHPKGALSIALSSNGRLVATGGSDHRARVWDWRANIVAKEIEHPEEVTEVAFSSDAKYLATGAGRTVRVWEIDSAIAKELAELPADDGVKVVSFSPSGRYLVATGTATTARFWDWRAKRRIAEVSIGAAARAAAFSPDEKQVSIGSEYGAATTSPFLTSDLVDEACRRLASYLVSDFDLQRHTTEIVRKACPSLP